MNFKNLFSHKKNEEIKINNKPYSFAGAGKRNYDIKDIRIASGHNTGNFVVGEYGLETIKHIEYNTIPLFNNLDSGYINENYSKIIILATNWFARYMENIDYNRQIKIFKKIKIPIVLIGLGAEMPLKEYNKRKFIRRLPKSMIKFYRTIADSTPSISVRGYLTQELLDMAGIKNTTVTGCPSWFVNETTNPKIIKKDYSDDFKISFNGDYSSTYDDTYNATFKKMAQCKNAQYLAQSEFTLIDLLDRKKEIPENNFLTVAEKLRMNVDNLPKDFKKYIYFDNIEDWENYIKQVDFSIGMRIHGTIIALKNGTPAVLIPHGGRVKEMADLFRIPQVSFNDFIKDDFSIRKIYEEANWDEMYKTYPKLLSNYISFLNMHGLTFKGRIFDKETKTQAPS